MGRPDPTLVAVVGLGSSGSAGVVPLGGSPRIVAADCLGCRPTGGNDVCGEHFPPSSAAVH
jgi:hypothetical protein